MAKKSGVWGNRGCYWCGGCGGGGEEFNNMLPFGEDKDLYEYHVEVLALVS